MVARRGGPNELDRGADSSARGSQLECTATVQNIVGRDSIDGIVLRGSLLPLLAAAAGSKQCAPLPFAIENEMCPHYRRHVYVRAGK